MRYQSTPDPNRNERNIKTWFAFFNNSLSEDFIALIGIVSKGNISCQMDGRGGGGGERNRKKIRKEDRQKGG